MSKKSKKPRLTPEQQSRRDKERRAVVLASHDQCDMEIRQRGPNWGLYCQQHNRWMRWLDRKELNEVRQMDIPMIIQT